MKFPYSFLVQPIESVLNSLIDEISSVPDYVGACLLITSAHGYEFQKLIVQHPDQTFTIQEWSDIGNGIETTISSLDLDLPAELVCLRNENKGREIYHNVDGKSGLEGRYVSVFVIVGSDAENFVCSNLLLNGEYENNAVNRILRAVFGLEEKVTLV